MGDAAASDAGQPSSSAGRVAPQRVLGFDYGARRIGVAIGQRITGTAQALGVIGNGAGGPEWARIDAAVREWRPDALVVGLPLMLDGSEQDTSRAARRFGTELAQRYALPLHTHDERLTSREADRQFAESRRAGIARRRDAAQLDAVAARLIVESFLASLPAEPPA
jgi:putative Holliday junction resolvase